MKQKVAVIGAGVSGLTTARMLKDRYEVTVFEKEDRAGGLIRCRSVDGSLFHTCGGHVFNSKRKDVLDWFWTLFSEDEFAKASRHACVFMDKGDSSLSYTSVPYPIENHMYCFGEDTQRAFYNDLDTIDRVKGQNAAFADYNSFGDFLKWRFGKTLYELYFKPYNAKVWRRDLDTVPMSWMEGKLPMPTTQEMRENNANRVEEQQFVHSSFWYERKDGSQYLADKLAEGVDVRLNTDIRRMEYADGKWRVGHGVFDHVVFCGNIKDMVKAVGGVDLSEYAERIERLGYHGTTAVFCEIDANPYSWIYQPSSKHESHRIICTGNFAPSNNSPFLPSDRITGTIEFTDAISKEDIMENLRKIPLHPKYLAHQYHPYTYPIQDADTRRLVQEIKSKLAPHRFFFTGRFADWEYYNMDVAMGAAMDLCKAHLF